MKVHDRNVIVVNGIGGPLPKRKRKSPLKKMKTNTINYASFRKQIKFKAKENERPTAVVALTSRAILKPASKSYFSSVQYLAVDKEVFKHETLD